MMGEEGREEGETSDAAALKEAASPRLARSAAAKKKGKKKKKARADGVDRQHSVDSLDEGAGTLLEKAATDKAPSGAGATTNESAYDPFASSRRSGEGINDGDATEEDEVAPLLQRGASTDSRGRAPGDAPSGGSNWRKTLRDAFLTPQAMYLNFLLITMIVTRSADGVLTGRITKQMAHYIFVWSSFIYMILCLMFAGPIIVGYWIYDRMTGSETLPARRIKMRTFVWFGLLTALTNLMSSIPAPLVAGFLQTLLAKGGIVPMQMICDAVFAKTRFRWCHYLSVALVVAACLVSIVPGFTGGQSVGPWYMILLLFLSNAPSAALNTYMSYELKKDRRRVHEEQLRGGRVTPPINVWHFNFLVNLWTIPTSLLFLPIFFTPKLVELGVGIAPADLGPNLRDGFKCYFQVGTITSNSTGCIDCCINGDVTCGTGGNTFLCEDYPFTPGDDVPAWARATFGTENTKHAAPRNVPGFIRACGEQAASNGANLCCDQCFRKPWAVSILYIGFNIVFNQLMYMVFKAGSATLSTVANVFCIGLTSILFTVPWIAGIMTKPLDTYNIISLMVVILGILVYRMKPEECPLDDWEREICAKERQASLDRGEADGSFEPGLSVLSRTSFRIDAASLSTRSFGSPALVAMSEGLDERGRRAEMLVGDRRSRSIGDMLSRDMRYRGYSSAARRDKAYTAIV